MANMSNICLIHSAHLSCIRTLMYPFILNRVIKELFQVFSTIVDVVLLLMFLVVIFSIFGKASYYGVVTFSVQPLAYYVQQCEAKRKLLVTAVEELRTESGLTTCVSINNV